MSSDSTPPTPARFTLPVAAWIAWGLYAVVVLGQFAAGNRSHDAFAIGHLMGSVLGMLLLPTLSAWIAWWLGGRRTLVSNITFFVVFALSLVGSLTNAARRDQTTTTLARADQDRRQPAAEPEAARKSGKSADRKKTNSFAERTADHLHDLTQKATGGDRTIAQAAQSVTAEFTAANRRYNEALAGLNVAAFFTLSPTLTEERIEARRQAVDEFIEANTQLQSVQTNGVVRLKREFDKRGVPAAAARAALTGYEESTAARIPILLKVREADAQLAEAMLDFLDIAAGRQGAWKANEGGTAITFENRATRERYNELLDRVRTISAEQTEYQQRLAEMTK